MILERDEYQTVCEFIAENAGTNLGEKAVKAWIYYRDDNGTTDDYVVIKVKGYYAIAKIVDEWQPIEISTYVQPFDKEKVYPLQRIEREINFVY